MDLCKNGRKKQSSRLLVNIFSHALQNIWRIINTIPRCLYICPYLFLDVHSFPWALLSQNCLHLTYTYIFIYIISSVMHAFWLVLTYDLLKDRCIDDIIIKTVFNSLLYNTNRFQVAVHLFSNRSQTTSKCGKNISDILGCALCATFLFLPHFDVICDLLLNRRTAAWNLFVKYMYVCIYLYMHVCIYVSMFNK